MNNGKADILDHEKTLHILKEIKANPQVTQRDLSEKCYISLGKVNFLVNSLVNKGIIKVQNFKNSKNRLAYMYLLTPEGIKWKIGLTYKFFQWKTQEYERLKKEIEYYKNEVSANGYEPAEHD